MNQQWAIKTHGDPLCTLQQFVHNVWLQVGLAGMLVSTSGNEDTLMNPHLIEDPNELSQVNPFKPIMTMNVAQLVPAILVERTGVRLGALLRPCELRALIEMVKHDSFSIKDLLTISVDCLGTFSPEEYKWRAARKSPSQGTISQTGLSQDTLQFARQGGIMAYRFRDACQICESPGAQGADLNISVFGLPVRQVILVQARDETTAERLRLSAFADTVADSELVQQHERTLLKAVDRHRRTMERIFQDLSEILPQGIDRLIEQLEDCGPCQACMSVCPICTVVTPQRSADGHYQRESVVRWLLSCAGCGMCEQACPNHLPLGAIFVHIRNKLDEEYRYVPGRSLEDLLPAL